MVEQHCWNYYRSLKMDLLDRINQRMYSYDEIRDMEIVLEMALLIDDNTKIDEAFDISVFKSSMSSVMKAAGLHSEKSGPGLISIALKSGKIMAEFIWHVLKAAAGNKESKIRVKELANTKITKEDFLNFIMKLDLATLHIITGPLHLVDAITGWHIGVQIKTKVDDVTTKATKAIENLIDAAKSTEAATRKKLKSLMHGISKLFGIESIQQDIKQL